MPKTSKFNSMPSSFMKFLSEEKMDIVTTVIIRDSIPDDILERISGYESDEDGAGNTYSSEVLGDILSDENDDTNETTRFRIELLYDKIKAYDYFTVL